MTYSTFTIETLNKMISENMAALPEDDINATIDLMALIDTRYNYNDTVDQYNTRLRNSVKNNFNKGFLNDDMKTTFRTWEAKLEELPMTASRVEIFSLASERALSIIGL